MSSRNFQFFGGIVNRVNTKEKVVALTFDDAKPGSIILLHPMYDEKDITINSIKGIIEGLKEKGYTFKTVNQLLEMEKK